MQIFIYIYSIFIYCFCLSHLFMLLLILRSVYCSFYLITKINCWNISNNPYTLSPLLHSLLNAWQFGVMECFIADLFKPCWLLIGDSTHLSMHPGDSICCFILSPESIFDFIIVSHELCNPPLLVHNGNPLF